MFESSDCAEPAADVGPPPAVRAGLEARLSCGLLALGCAAVLSTAVWLSPDPRGYGTHQQFGVGGCSMLVRTGYPCPTCGMTTAFAHTVRGQWLSAARAQPAGFLLALGTAVAGGLFAWIAITGQSVAWVQRWLARVSPLRLMLWTLGVLLAGWGGKMLIGLLDGSLPALQR